MKNVVSFPGIAQKQKLLPEPLSNHKNYLVIKDFEFTCPHCKTTSSFEQTNLIFKRLQFYCGGCGQMHLVANPAFRNDR